MKTEQEIRDEIARLKKLYKDTGGYTEEPVSNKVDALNWVLAKELPPISEARYHKAGAPANYGQYCTTCKLQLLPAGDTPFRVGATVLIDGDGRADRDGLSDREQDIYKGVKPCSL
jgi:hypothetical protein